MKNITKLKITMVAIALSPLVLQNSSVTWARDKLERRTDIFHTEGEYQLAQTSRCRLISTSGDRLLIRSRPTVNSTVIGSFSNGQQVIIGNRGNGGWVPVALKGGRVGYISARYLKMCP